MIKIKYLIIFLVLLGCGKSNKTSFLELIDNRELFSVHIINAESGQFGQELGQTTINSEPLIYYLGGDSAVHFINLQGDTSSFSLHQWLGTRIKYVDQEMNGVFVEHEAIWFDSPIDDSLYRISISDKKINAFYVDIPQRGGNIISHRAQLSPSKYGIHKLKNGNYIIPISHYIHNRPMEIPDYFPVYGVFELKGNVFHFLSPIGDLPVDYHKKQMYYLTVDDAFKGDTMLINYCYSDSVDVIINNNTKRIYMGSDKSLSFRGLQGDPGDFSAIRKLFLMNQRYSDITYDPYRNVFYRSFLERSVGENGKIVSHKNWKILVFDANFAKLGELHLSGKEFDHTLFFVVKDGILLRDFRKYNKDVPTLGHFELLSWKLSSK